MTRFTPSPNGSHLRGKRKEGEPCTYVTREGSGRVTSFLTSSTGHPTSYRIGARRCGKAERGVVGGVWRQRMRGEGKREGVDVGE
jgi:hypothetical protein